MTSFKHGEYVASSLDGKSFPEMRSPTGSILPEIALVGRSNVGKSSLINHLIGGKSLARVSSTPGKTRMINFFAIDQTLGLVDLPGYGYAKVPKEMRKSWAEGLENYFSSRKSLQLILLLLDIRRIPTEEDLAMAEWCAHHNKPLLVIFTKSDKVLEREQEKLVRASLETLNAIEHLKLQMHVIHSIKNRGAKEQLIQSINTILRNCN